MKARLCLVLAALGAWLCTAVASAAETIPDHRAKEIFDAAPDRPQAEPVRPRRVLIFITPPHLMPKDPHKGYCIPYGTHAFEAMGRKTGAFEPVVSDDLAQFAPENIGTFDAIVLNNSSGPWITPTEADLAKTALKGLAPESGGGNRVESVEAVLRKSLLDYVSNGGGLVAIHYAIGANRQWPEFHQLLGATFTGHPWNEEVGVTVEEPGHPLLAAFDAGGFSIADEIYQFGEPYARDQVRVLLSLDPARTFMGVRFIRRTDNDFALAWVKPYRKGRVFYTSFGHRTELYWNRDLLRFYLDAIQFATGDLQAPSAPRNGPPPKRDQGFVSIFNGKDLTGWEGDTRFWSVRDGAITGQTTADNRVTENTFLIWKGGEPADFELKCRFKLTGGNSGIYFHAEKRPPGGKGEALVGPQADFSADQRWTGVLMEYTKRDILAERGERVRIDRNGNRKVIGSVGEPAELLKAVRPEDWNEYHFLARGGRVVLTINGVTMCEVEDQDPRRTPAGHLALQVHQGPPMTVQFKEIQIKRY